MTALDTQRLAEAFCAWPLPASVCADLCASDPKYNTGPHAAIARSGTNLLSVAEAKAFFDHLVSLGLLSSAQQGGEAHHAREASVGADELHAQIAQTISEGRNDGSTSDAIADDILDLLTAQQGGEATGGAGNDTLQSVCALIGHGASQAENQRLRQAKQAVRRLFKKIDALAQTTPSVAGEVKPDHTLFEQIVEAIRISNYPDEQGIVRTDRDEAARKIMALIEGRTPVAGAVPDEVRAALASLVAAISILERSHKEKKPANKVVASDAMFVQMLVDYQKVVDGVRALAQPQAEGQPVAEQEAGR